MLKSEVGCAALELYFESFEIQLLVFNKKYERNAMHWDAKRQGQEEGDHPEEEELLIVYSGHIRY